MSDTELVVLEEVKYPVSIDEIKAFKEEWAEVPTLDPKDGVKNETFLEVKKAHLRSVTLRNMIEKKRKSLKEPALAYGKQVDAIAKEYKALLEDTEARLFSERHKVEAYEREQEQKRIDAELERQRTIQNKIDIIRMIPSNFIGSSSEHLTNVYSNLAIPDPIDFDDKLELAIEVYKDTMDKLETMIAQAKNAEEVEAVRAKEAEERAKEDAEREAKAKAEREAFEKEKAEFEAEKAKAKAEQEAKEEAERMKAIEAEAKELELAQEAEARKAEALKDKTQNIAEDEATHEITLILNEGGTAKDILEAILDERISHVRWVIDYE